MLLLGLDCCLSCGSSLSLSLSLRLKLTVLVYMMGGMLVVALLPLARILLVCVDVLHLRRYSWTLWWEDEASCIVRRT